MNYYCSICGKDIGTSEFGIGTNNAEPVNSGRCCDSCNDLVLFHRIAILNRQRLETQKRAIEQSES